MVGASAGDGGRREEEEEAEEGSAPGRRGRGRRAIAIVVAARCVAIIVVVGLREHATTGATATGTTRPTIRSSRTSTKARSNAVRPTEHSAAC